MRYLVLPLLATLLISSCTTVSVQPVDQHLNISTVCVERNPEVKVPDFLPVVLTGLRRNGVSGRVLESSRDIRSDCQGLLKYTARRTWDITPFLRTARLELWGKDGMLLGAADYQVANGFNPSKYDSTAKKIDPLLDQLFAQ